MTLPVRGVHYDVGHQYDAGPGQAPRNTRPHFDRAGVEADMAMIAGQLHANAVRATGTDLSRVTIAVGLALEAGLTVWFSSHPGDLAGDDIVSYPADAARMAEDLRSSAGSMVMVAGRELSLFCAGYLPGPTLEARLDALTGAAAAPGLPASFSELPRMLNATLGQSAAAIRDHFRGPSPMHQPSGKQSTGRGSISSRSTCTGTAPTPPDTETRCAAICASASPSWFGVWVTEPGGRARLTDRGRAERRC